MRVVTDLRPLKSTSEGVGWPFCSAADLQKNILPDSKLFWYSDFLSWYYQIPLTEESKNLTSFITPFSKFCYRRLLQGWSDSRENINFLTEGVTKGLKRVIKSVDDLLG